MYKETDCKLIIKAPDLKINTDNVFNGLISCSLTMKLMLSV